MIPVRQSIGGIGNLMFKQAYLYAQLMDGNIPDIYVQSAKYWENNSEIIKRLFGEGIGYTDKVSIQIRRGDYLNTNFYIKLWDTDYYQKAIAMFPNDEFLVFCHDGQNPEQDRADKIWCRKFLNDIIPGRFQIHEPKEEHEDLNKMASCKHNIIANSSFGWWAGFLNKNPEKKVICPKEWFTDGFQRCDLLEEFIKI